MKIYNYNNYTNHTMLRQKNYHLYFNAQKNLPLFLPSGGYVYSLLNNILQNKMLYNALVYSLYRVTNACYKTLISKTNLASFSIRKKMPFGLMYIIDKASFINYIESYNLLSHSYLDGFDLFVSNPNFSNEGVKNVNWIKNSFFEYGISKMLYHVQMTSSVDFSTISKLFENSYYGYQCRIQTFYRNFMLNKQISSVYLNSIT